ncbi:MAG: SoxR reducing system RseC family protein [Deltaproteobacteria bacterium]|nr:SoxR reducing system RseC family protein [Deltaproteobacteria bacterium]
MITEQGTIERISGRNAVVRIEKSSACATCQSRESCGEASGKDMILQVANELRAGKGDRIEISLPSGSFLMLSLLVYMLPVAALIGGAIAGGAVARALHINLTLASIAGGCLAMGVTFYALKRFDKSTRARREFQPRMTRVLLRSERGHPDTTEE